MSSFKKKLENYAELTVKVGVNIQQGQTLLIEAPIHAAEFVREVAKQAYAVGAKNVHVEWNDEQVALLKYLNAPDEAFEEFPKWKSEGYIEMAKDNVATLNIFSSNPEIFKDVNPQRMANWRKVASRAHKEYSDYRINRVISWSIVSIPEESWAKKVFPNVSKEEAVELLWEKIFMMTRADQDNPIEAWADHVKGLKTWVNFLNEKQFKKLHYRAPGTDLHVELPSNHIWLGGGTKNAKDVNFVANIPTEEVFTAPHRTGVNGYVSSSMPLNYSGTVIDNIKITFDNGRIVDFEASQGYETLKRLIETDEGSHFLGEIALVPHDSPISNTNVIYYNTLFDENASCHLAIGKAYPTCIKDGANMNAEELEKNGINDSLTHVDFMIGSAELEIDAIAQDGSVVPLFRAGNWVK